MNFSNIMKACFWNIILLGTISLRGVEPSWDWRKIETNWNSWIKTPESDLKKKAEAGDALAKYFYFVRNAKDQPPLEDPRWALGDQFLADASDAGIPHALRESAWQIREKNSSRFISLLQAAAKTGLPTAQLELALEYLEAVRAPLDEEKAVELIRSAADSGYAAAQFELSEMYASGMGESRFPEETPFKLCQKAALNGNRDAMFELAQRYRTGYAIDKDFLEAARWQWRSGQLNPTDFNKFLDPHYEPNAESDSDTKLFNRFFSLYVRAQVRHDREVMKQVGHAFFEGELGKKNVKTAFIWLSLAQKAGNSTATMPLEKVRGDLSQAEISKLDQDVSDLQSAWAAQRQSK